MPELATSAFNSAKHHDELDLQIIDDGVGGATLDGGTGLRGLLDRVTAADGRLDVISPPGKGTRIRARLPCG